MAWYDYIFPTGAGPMLGLWGETDAEKIRTKGMNSARDQQDQLRREMEKRREQDLAATMAFYGPAMSSLSSLYGIPQSAWGPAAPGNAPMGTPKTGTVAGMPASMAPLRPDIKPMVSPMGGQLTSLPAGTRLAGKRPVLSGLKRF